MDRQKMQPLLILALLGLDLSQAAMPAAARPLPAPAADCQLFSQTGKSVGALFLDYWRQHGGLAQQGYPIEEAGLEVSPTDGQTYMVQYFERAVFEWHPENPAPYNVLLSLLGTFRYQQRYPQGAPNQQPNTTAGARFFFSTGHTVGGAFLTYWETHGGLAQQGYPISEEFNERSALDGLVYRVQYFERAVFEWHPENRGTAYEVLLAQLGTFRYQEYYPGGWPANLLRPAFCTAPAPTPTPARGPDRDRDGIPDAKDQCPDGAENYNKVFDTDGCPDKIQDLYDFGAQDINDYWKGVLESNGVAYSPPNEFVGYTTRIRTACGPADLENAFYCPRSHSIYYDSDFLADQLDRVGDFAPVTILAHEWGHLVQANLGIEGSFTIEIELQADCFAGAWAKHAGNKGLLEEGDLEEGATSLFNVGDPEDVPWFEPGAHGQPQQRVDAFTRGLEEGPGGCSLR